MWQIIVILICLGLNALIAAAEFAFIAVSKPHLKKLVAEGDKAAKRVLSLRENPERTLSILQLGITFIGVVAAAVGGAEFGTKLTNWFQRVGLGPNVSEVFAILLFVVPYTYINVVLSELLPKSIALRNPKWVIFHVDRWLIFLEKILAPIVFLLEKSTKLAVRFFFSWMKHEELEGEEAIAVGKLIRPYMLNLAKIERKRVRDVMISWEEVDKITIDAPVEEVKKLIFRTGHTRVPIVENDHPIGLLLSKEFLVFYDKKDPNWQSLKRRLIKLKAQDTLIHGLRLMQSHRCHLSVVFTGDNPMGIVTIEDILEEVVGEIYDEDDVKSFFK